MPDPVQTIIDQSKTMLSALEDRRQRYLQILCMALPMGFAVVCALAALAVGGGEFPWVMVLILTVVTGLIAFQSLNGLYRRQTKNAFLTQIATAVGLTYHKNGLFPVDDFNRHKILPHADRVKIEDGFSGAVNGVHIAFQEATLTDITPAQNRNEQDRETVVFWGLLLKIRIGKILSGHTVVLPRNALQVFFRTTFSKFEKVNLVSPSFDDRFNVMSTDQVEARYVLDPAFIERFIEAGDLLGSKWIEASFTDQEIAFAIQRNKPMFEIGWLGRSLTGATLEKTADELRAVIQLVDALKLNPHTGLGASLRPRAE